MTFKKFSKLDPLTSVNQLKVLTTHQILLKICHTLLLLEPSTSPETVNLALDNTHHQLLLEPVRSLKFQRKSLRTSR